MHIYVFMYTLDVSAFNIEQIFKLPRFVRTNLQPAKTLIRRVSYRHMLQFLKSPLKKIFRKWRRIIEVGDAWCLTSELIVKMSGKIIYVLVLVSCFAAGNTELSLLW